MVGVINSVVKIHPKVNIRGFVNSSISLDLRISASLFVI